MGIEDAQADEIIEAHAETVEALKQQRDGYKSEAEGAQAAKAELEALKARGDGGFEDKYNAEREAFEAYKAQVEGERAEAEKSGLYRKLLARAGVDPRRIDAVLKVSDLSGVSVRDGAIEGADKLEEAIKADWADFITTTSTQGATVSHPPVAGGGKGAITAEEFRRMGLRERNALHESDPDTYRALAHPNE